MFLTINYVKANVLKKTGLSIWDGKSKTIEDKKKKIGNSSKDFETYGIETKYTWPFFIALHEQFILSALMDCNFQTISTPLWIGGVSNIIFIHIGFGLCRFELRIYVHSFKGSVTI